VAANQTPATSTAVAAGTVHRQTRHVYQEAEVTTAAGGSEARIVDITAAHRAQSAT
jgi:hypothetical protein